MGAALGAWVQRAGSIRCGRCAAILHSWIICPISVNASAGPIETTPPMTMTPSRCLPLFRDASAPYTVCKVPTGRSGRPPLATSATVYWPPAPSVTTTLVPAIELP